MISVIIPVYNEEKLLAEKESYYKELAKTTELIVVNGQSTDHTKEQAEKFARVLSSRKGRAFQMNVGASEATREILLFMPTEAEIDPQHFPAIEQAYREKFIGGCFTQIILHPNPLYKLLAWIGNYRARQKKIFFVNQGIFVRKDAFDHIGGFPQMPVCEDILMSEVLKDQGNVKILAHPIKYIPDGKKSIWAQILLNVQILISVRKMALHKLAARYMNLK